MKCAYVLAILAFAEIYCISASALPHNSLNGQNGWYVPYDKDSFQWMDTSEIRDLMETAKTSTDRSFSNSKVDFYLYTKNNPMQPTKMESTEESVSASGFNSSLPTRILVPGWHGSYTDNDYVKIRAAWFTRGEYNIIIVDWEEARSSNFIVPILATPDTGKKVAEFINFLRNNCNLSLETVHIIGYSLGCHVAGYAGKNIKSGQVNVIVGLDPPKVLFPYMFSSKRLASTDAYYVESIQTSGQQLGYLEPIGRGTFYPNGGNGQPGCDGDLVTQMSCSHGRAIEYYVEAVRGNDFLTMKCSSNKDALNHNCGSTYSDVKMGAVTNSSLIGGVFYVPVRETPPYGMGANFKLTIKQKI